MAYKLSLGGRHRALWAGGYRKRTNLTSTSQGATRQSHPRLSVRYAGGPKRETASALSIAAGILFLGALAAASFYAVNGSWATPGQMEAKMGHETFPIVAARRGFMEPLEAENVQREQRGKRLLAMPLDRHQRAAEQRPNLVKLQQQLDNMQSTAARGAP